MFITNGLIVPVVNGHMTMKQLARSPVDIGHAMRLARRRKQLTQQQLSEACGVRQETISRLENGSEGARLDTVFDICAALDLELVITERSKGSTDFLEDTL